MHDSPSIGIQPPEHDYSVAVVGSGLTGLTAALALADLAAKRGEKIAHIAPRNEGKDGRTTALLMPSVQLLGRLGIWDKISHEIAELSTMRLIDGSKRLLRAPLTDFKSADLGLDAFGYNVANAKLGLLLEAALEEHISVDRFYDTVANARTTTGKVELDLNEGPTISAALIAAADGRNSMLRNSAGITVREWSYPQTAIVLNFQHTLPSRGISTEFHTETGPFTQVPLPATSAAKHRSSLVWVVRPEQVDEILNEDLQGLSAHIEHKMHSILGVVRIEGKPQAFPLKGMVAKQFMANNIALLGESAHVFPPIGAQGFNLGLRDVEALLEALSRQNAASVEAHYNANRLADVLSRTGAVDILNRSLLTDFLPIQAARAFTLATLGEFGWLRRKVMQRGLGG